MKKFLEATIKFVEEVTGEDVKGTVKGAKDGLESINLEDVRDTIGEAIDTLKTFKDEIVEELKDLTKK